MRTLDRLLARWRIHRVSRFIRPSDHVLDIGSHDGSLLLHLRRRKGVTGLGVDPEYLPAFDVSGLRFVRRSFPCLIDDDEGFDAICCLAVLEHVPESEMTPFVGALRRFVRSSGRVVLTVPSPKVDRILDVLMKLRLVDGIESGQHHGFDVERVQPIMEEVGFRLLSRTRFQLGLNNVFVFEAD